MPRTVALIVFAIAAGAQAPVAAQTTLLYGRLNLTLEYVDAKNPEGDAPAIQRVSFDANRSRDQGT